MADKKISQLTGATTPLTGTEVLPIVQGGSTVKVSVDDLTTGKTVKASTFDTNVTASKVTLSGTTLAAGGSNTDVSIRIDPKGTGGVGVGVAPVNKYQVFQASAASVPAAGASGHTAAFGDSGFGLAVGALTSGNAYLAATRWDGVSANYVLSLQPNGGNVSIGNGDLVIGTAAKGIDFSANTPSTGSTSRLLNWYEEGTWTPNQGPGLTVVGAFSSNGRYSRIGRLVIISGEVIGATSVACSAGGIISSNLPITVGTIGSGAVTVGNVNQSSTCLAFSNVLYCMTAITATAGINFTAIYIV